MRPVAFQTVTLRRKKGERGLEEAPHLLRPRMPPTLRFVNRRMIYLVFWTETERNHASLHLVGTIAASGDGKERRWNFPSPAFRSTRLGEILYVHLYATVADKAAAPHPGFQRSLNSLGLNLWGPHARLFSYSFASNRTFLLRKLRECVDWEMHHAYIES